ncbi:MAG: hypothetical protein IPK04_00815 [Bdellovibrionales bacterium]|jgi:hypothetical protein|nr:hypothetical protein [Bdellovibrionales bacterium]
MNFKHIIMIAVSIYGVFVFVACGNKNSSDPVASIQCPAGSSFSANGNCYDQYGRIIGGVGVNPGITNMDAGYLADNVRYNNIQITDFAAYKDFLENAHSVCNRGNYNWGTANCDAWANSYFLVGLQTSATQNSVMRLVFYVQFNESQNGDWSFSVELPSIGELFAGMLGYPIWSKSGPTRHGFDVKGVASVINANKGFEARGYGPYDTGSNRSLIQLQVDNGKVLDQELRFKLHFHGKQMATGTFGRCNTPDCL